MSTRTLRLQPSRRLSWLLVMQVLAWTAVPLALPAPRHIGWLAVLVFPVAAAWARRTHHRTQAVLPAGLRLSDDDLTLFWAGGDEETLDLQADSRTSPWLTVLCWRDALGQRRELAIWPDQLPRADYKALCTWLRWRAPRLLAQADARDASDLVADDAATP